MKKCKSCQMEIDSKASKCPHCQADQRNWFGRHKIITGIILFIVVMGIIGNLAGSSKDTKNSIATLTDQSQKVQPTVTLAPTQTPSPTSVPVAFDKNSGNNPVAAEYSKKLKDILYSSMPNLIGDVYIELSPEDMGGKSKDDYLKSADLTYITVVVDPTVWSNTDDSVKKDFVTILVKYGRNNIGGSPNVKVSDGIRTVAEGTWSIGNGEANITLK